MCWNLLRRYLQYPRGPASESHWNGMLYSTHHGPDFIFVVVLTLAVQTDKCYLYLFDALHSTRWDLVVVPVDTHVDTHEPRRQEPRAGQAARGFCSHHATRVRRRIYVRPALNARYRCCYESGSAILHRSCSDHVEYIAALPVPCFESSV